MLHIVHLLQRRLGDRAPRVVALLATTSALALAAGLLLASR